MAEAGTFEIILGEIGQALLPLRSALRSPESFFALMLKLGWQADAIPQPLQDLGNGLETLFDALRKVLGDDLRVEGSVSLDTGGASAGGGASISADDIGRVVHAVQQIIGGIRAIAAAPDAAFPANLIADGFKQKFPRQLVDYLLINYLQTYHGSLAFGLRSLGVIKAQYVASTGQRLPYVHYTLDVAAVPTALGDPSVVLQNAFGWGGPAFDFGALASQVDNLLSTLNIDTRIETLPTAAALALEGGVDRPGAPQRRMLRGVIFERARNAGTMSADIRLLALPQRGGDPPGFALMPAFNGLFDVKMSLFDDIAVTIRSDLNVQGGIALQIRPGKPIEIVTGFAQAGSPVSASGSIDVRAERSNLDNTPTVILGSPTSTRLQFKKVGGVGGVRLSGSGAADLFAEFELGGLEFLFDPSAGDGFISKIIPANGIGFSTDLTIGLSHRDGFYFRGTSNLEISVPAHVQVGPIDVQSLTISANPKDGKLPISLGATLKGDLGPLKAVVENIGLTATLSFPSNHDGNLGPVDLQLGFKPPNGIGLSLDAGIVRGGGYLFIDADRGEYAGALELTFAEFLSIKAVGIITTKMPDGSKGFSLLIILSVEFGTGIQLGFGFTLLAVGGLLGLNRTMNLQALTAGVRTGALNSVMFPKDIIANAPKIISDLRAFFPPQEGTFLIGPMLKLGWGTPTLVSVALGVIIEIPGNIAILGVLRVAIPADEIAIINLQVQFFGAIEFDKKRLFFFAALFESRIAFLTLDGEMGLLVAWGDDANFVLSVGGFHPQFSPPPLPFPSPNRIAISLLNTPVYRVRVEAYFAVTSNTVQFGARVEVFYGISVLNAQGHLQFDALFQFSPFHFMIEISASFSVNAFGFGLFSVGIGGSLDGPEPWHIKGHGSISLLFWDIDVEFETTWGDSQNTMLPPIVVLPLLQAELNKPDSWRALPPASTNLFVTLRKLPSAEAALIMHPVGVLHISQRAMPLEITLDKVGNQKPSDVTRLSIAITSGGLAKKGDAFEQFAPAQFQNFSDADKLSRPAFAPERSGLDLSAAGADVRSSVMIKRIVRYEEIIIDSNFKRFARRFSAYVGSLFNFFLSGNATARSSVSQATKAKMQPFAEKIGVAPETYTVAFQATNKPFAAETTTFHSEASAREYLKQQIAADGALADVIHVIPSYERAA
jgi:hypothetical protein